MTMPEGFKKIETLGKGTFGTVFLCFNRKFRQCVLKEISVDQQCAATSQRFKEMAQHEIYLLLHLEHPRIIQLLDYFCDEKYIYIVMEYANNGTLTNLIEQRRGHRQYNYLTLDSILSIFCDILMGIEYLHIRHVIHRDLKADNILIGQDGRIKIADFGISKIYSVSNEKHNNNMACKLGTPFYMPPETISRGEVSFAMDIWALGCILYELAMFQHPFTFAKDVDILVSMTLHKFYKKIPENLYKSQILNDLVEMMLEPEKAKRVSVSGIIRHPDITTRFFKNYYYSGPTF